MNRNKTLLGTIACVAMLSTLVFVGETKADFGQVLAMGHASATGYGGDPFQATNSARTAVRAAVGVLAATERARLAALGCTHLTIQYKTPSLSQPYWWFDDAGPYWAVDATQGYTITGRPPIGGPPIPPPINP